MASAEKQKEKEEVPAQNAEGAFASVRPRSSVFTLRFPAADDKTDLIIPTFEVSVSATAFLPVKPVRDDRIPRSR